ncbi:MAG TPA: carboxypeptidase regulatory-like domain-containing protein [Candidatus Dormibacteraeota bacterium]|nr:carboxypeptidase regulatory-like domain-containing protein [Candidatus Dormibacteraeota bacterium]
MRYWKALLITSTLLWLVPTASAQVTNGTIVGVVTDSSGAVIPQVQVTVIDTSTGFQRTVQTGGDGGYIVEDLKPGSYEVTAVKAGFKEKSIKGITLQVSQRARIDIGMEVGSAGERVEVQGTAPIIETESASVGKVITTRDVLNLPLNGRQFLQLATLTPGVQKASIVYHETTGGSISVNGMSAFANNTMVDGIMNQETGAGRMTFSPSIDAIQEFKIQSNTYDAQYGRTGGAQIEVLTKRGSNAYHGSVYEFWRNDALDARPLFQPGSLPPFSRHQFGGTFGGHIPHLRKDFFFFSYEGLRSDQGLTAVLSLPPATLRAGDFSGTGTTIYDPQTLNTTTGRRQPFPGNMIPSNRISPVTKFFLDKFVPVPAGTGITNNYVSNPTQSQNINQISVRYDRDFSEHDSVMFRYTRNKYTALLPRGDSGVATPLVGLGEDVTLYGQNHKVGWTHFFSNTTLNSLNLGFSQYYQNRFNQTTGKGFVVASGMQGLNAVEAGIPYLQISGFSSIGDNYVSPIRQPFNNYVVEDTLSKVWGKHSIRIGASFLYNRTQSHLDIFDRGLISFSPRYTTATVGGAGNQYNALAEFLLGLPSSGFVFLNPLDSDWRSHTVAGYIQDNWNVSPNLTVNLGLRYDVYTRPFDTQDRFAAFDLEKQVNVYPGKVPTLPGVPAGSVVAETLGYPRNLQFPTTWNNWSPRAGFAWRPFQSQKVVLRGGYGLFYNWLVIDSATGLALGPPWVPSTGISCNRDVPCVTATRPFSTTVVPSTSGNVASKTNRTPYVHQFSLDVQYALTNTLGLQVGYVGNASGNNLIRMNINQPAPGPGSVTSRLPYPKFSSLTAIQTIGTAHYDSLQASLRKTYDRVGLVLLASYTWSHALGDSISGPQINEGQPLRDFRNYKAEYGNTPYDVRHIASISWIYELPWGKGKPLAGNLSGVADAFVGGWRFEGIASLRTGSYLTPGDIVDVSNAGGGRPDVIGDPNSQDHSSRDASIKQWFNTSAFRRAPQFTFGNSGPGIIAGPGYNSFDLALHKRIAIKESMGLQFRLEAFNAFNHPNLGNPSTAFGAANFGQISSIVGSARSIQLGLRFDF